MKYSDFMQVMFPLHFCLNKWIIIFCLFFAVSTSSLFCEKFCQTHCEYFSALVQNKNIWVIFFFCLRHVDRDLCGNIIIPFILEYVFLELYIIAHLFVSPKKNIFFPAHISKMFSVKSHNQKPLTEKPLVFYFERKKYRSLGDMRRIKQLMKSSGR